MIFFTSDWHIGHANVLSYCDRPFSSVEDMHRGLVSNFRELVSSGDITYFLGDMSFRGTKSTKEIISQLPGYKVLLRGNHDASIGSCLNAGFDLVLNNADILIGDKRASLSHYPFEDLRYPDRAPQNTGQWLLHGHTHSKSRGSGKMIHVGVDAWDYKPVSGDAILTIIKGRG